MSIKILGGMARGFEVIAPQTSLTRPTSVLLKRRLFDSIQQFHGIHFFDICAGSGSIGLEAASRGAESVYFIELNPKVFSQLKTNIKKFQSRYKESCEMTLEKGDVKKFFKSYTTLIKDDETSFLFFDPPYEKLDLYHLFFDEIKALDFKGRFVIEACRQKTMHEDKFQEEFGPSDKVIRQGTSYFLVYDNR